MLSSLWEEAPVIGLDALVPWHASNLRLSSKTQKLPSITPRLDYTQVPSVRVSRVTFHPATSDEGKVTVSLVVQVMARIDRGHEDGQG